MKFPKKLSEKLLQKKMIKLNSHNIFLFHSKIINCVENMHKN